MTLNVSDDMYTLRKVCAKFQVSRWTGSIKFLNWYRDGGREGGTFCVLSRVASQLKTCYISQLECASQFLFAIFTWFTIFGTTIHSYIGINPPSYSRVGNLYKQLRSASLQQFLL